MPRGIIDPSVGSYENHPFFIKKANEAKAFLEKHPIPEEILKRKVR